MTALDLLVALARSSAGAAVLIGLVLGTQWLFGKRLSPRWRCALWSLVFIRLIPFSLPSSLSVHNLISVFTPNAAAFSIDFSPEVTEKTAQAEAPFAAPLSGAAKKAIRPATDAPAAGHDLALLEEEPFPQQNSAGATKLTALPRNAPRVIPWSLLAFLAWFAGALLFAGRIAFATLELRTKFRDARLVSDPSVLAVLKRACERLGVGRVPAITESPSITSPALYGCLRPRLILPTGFCSSYSHTELNHVFLHEVAHLKRRDPLLSWAAAVLQVLHWFNPLVWYAFARWRLDREVACDAIALDAAGGDQCRAYGATMLRLVERVSGYDSTPLLLGILESKQQLAHRLRMIVGFVPNRRWSLFALSLLCLLGVIGLTDANTFDSSTNEKKEETTAASKKSERTLRLIVLDDTTGKPISGAVVAAYNLRDLSEVSNQTPFRTTTSASGEVLLVVPSLEQFSEQERSFDVMVEHPDFGAKKICWFSDEGNVRSTLPESYTIRLRPGSTIGGQVRDEIGKPVAGAKIRVSGSNFDSSFQERGAVKKYEYDCAPSGGAPMLVADSEGRWSLKGVPSELVRLTVYVDRNVGSWVRFDTESVDRVMWVKSAEISSKDLKAGTAQFLLPAGNTISGVVTDPQGKPLAGANLRFSDSNFLDHHHSLTTDQNGKFELKHWTGTKLLINVRHDRFAQGIFPFEVKGDILDAHLALQPAKPLRIRIVDNHARPIKDAKIAAYPDYQTGYSPEWESITGAMGEASWANAPLSSQRYAIITKDYPVRLARLSADGTEHTIILRPGSEKQISVNIRVTDAASGKPVSDFVVRRRLPGSNTAFSRWDGKYSAGKFTGDLSIADFNKTYATQYRLQVHAPGYQFWDSERFEFLEGDQELNVALVKGSSPANPPIETRRGPPPVTEKTMPNLVPLADEVISLLQTGDVETYVNNTQPKIEHWKPLLPADYTSDPQATNLFTPERFAKSAKALRANAEHVLEIARAIGASPGTLRYTLKTAESRQQGKTGYQINKKNILVPVLYSLRIVLNAEAVKPGAVSTAKPGVYELRLREVKEFTRSWKIDGGLRWAAIPEDIATADVRSAIALFSRIEDGSRFNISNPFTGKDDPAFLKFGQHTIDLLRTRDAQAFVTAIRYPRAATQARWKLHGQGDAEECGTAWDRNTAELKAAAQNLFSKLDRIGVDFSGAKLTLRGIEAKRTAFEKYGNLEGANASVITMSFEVVSPKTTATGKPISGIYRIELGNALRLGGSWYLPDPKIRWVEMPDAVLDEEMRKELLLENHIAEKRSLPVGMKVPSVTMHPYDDKGVPVALSSLRGKVVVLEFWASWCGPCQEPMAKLQTLIAKHPEWKDRVAFLAVSIDETAAKAAAHAKNAKWDQTQNLWVGPGVLKADAAKAFRISSVPTLYVIDAAGAIREAGHPMSLDLEKTIPALLKSTPPR